MSLGPIVLRAVPCCLVLACAALAASARAQDGGAGTASGVEETAVRDGAEGLLDACDLLGWSDVAGKEPVEVHELLGGEDRERLASDERAFRDAWGWVLSETDGVVAVLDGAGTRRTVRRSDAPARSGDAVVRPLTPEAAVERVLHPPKLDWTQTFDAPEHADRWCARVIGAAQFRRAGRDDLSERLLASLEPWREQAPLEVARDQVAMRALWRVVVDFEQPEVPRSDLLRRLRVWDRYLRGTEHAPMAADLLREMERMVREDEQRSRRPAPAGEPTRAERIADLIWTLRDTDIAAQIRTGRNEWRNVGSEITAFGWDAVPPLIEALGDTRTTRSVTEWRPFHFPGHVVLRVGDHALDALREITGQDFSGQGVVARCGHAGWEDIRARAAAWWKEWGPRGEAAALADQVRTFRDWRRERAFRRLAVVAPTDALEFARARLREARTDLARREALADVGLCPGPDATAILRENLESQPGVDVRIRAALGLHARGEPDMKPVLLALWAEAAAWDKWPDRDTFRALVVALTRLDAQARAAVVAETRRHPEHTASTVAEAWRWEFVGPKAPELEGAARDYVADLALDVLAVPPLVALTRPADPDKRWRESGWRRDEAVAVLARLRGVSWDPKAGPVTRLRAMLALVAAERADRKIELSPEVRRNSEATLVEQVSPATDAGAGSVAALWIAAGNPVEPDDAALAPLRALLGKPLDEAAVEAAVRGAFRARPKGSAGVVLRLMRGDGPVVAEAFFDDGAGGPGLEFQMGRGDEFAETASHLHVNGPAMIDGEIDDWIRDRIAAALARAADGDWILDVRMTSK